MAPYGARPDQMHVVEHAPADFRDVGNWWQKFWTTIGVMPFAPWRASAGVIANPRSLARARGVCRVRRRPVVHLHALPGIRRGERRIQLPSSQLRSRKTKQQDLLFSLLAVLR